MSDSVIVRPFERIPLTTLSEHVAGLRASATRIAGWPVSGILDTLDAYGRALIDAPDTQHLDGVAFLSAWLRRSNLGKALELAVGDVARLDAFTPSGSTFLAAKPRGIVAMWMAANVATLPIFSIVPALLTKNAVLVKVAGDDLDGVQGLLRVLAAQPGQPSGVELCDCVTVAVFDHHQHDLAREMSGAADAKVVWGGAEATAAIRALPQAPHCVNIAFGPKYSIGVIARERQTGVELANTVRAFVRDIAAFDQRACSAPHTIFIERSPGISLSDVGRLFAAELAKLPPKTTLDAYTTVQILNARARWSLDPQRDVLASKGSTDWTVCMDEQIELKEAVQSRTIFLTAVDDLDQVVPLIHSSVQTIGIAFGDVERARRFADRACAAGAVRCVRPGLMNAHESPWDGRMLAADLVRWVLLKP